MSNDQQSDEDPEDSNVQEASALLRRPNYDGEHSISMTSVHRPRVPLPERRQSSLSIPSPNGLRRKPRTPNRVRFEVEEHRKGEHVADGLVPESDEEDYSAHESSSQESREISQHAPLLTGIEAPSVTVASIDFDFNGEDLLENNQSKSGMRSAFMNMANSIMYEPHMFRL
ncbi:MAG: hypothetical protein Q9186_002363 [Xanthomendoza sp. 1 TL-2023]